MKTNSKSKFVLFSTDISVFDDLKFLNDFIFDKKFENKIYFYYIDISIDLYNITLSLLRKKFKQNIFAGIKKLDSIKAIFFDMDKTIIAQESLVELAKVINQGDLMGKLTESAMIGEQDFIKNFKERIKIFKGNTLDIFDKAYKNISINKSLSDLIIYCNKKQIKCYIISGGLKPFTEKIASNLGFDDFKSNDLTVLNGFLTGDLKGDLIDTKGKLAWASHICKKNNIDLKNAVMIGDGANDIDIIKKIGFAVGYKPKDLLIDHINCVHNLGDYMYIKNFLRVLT